MSKRIPEQAAHPMPSPMIWPEVVRKRPGMYFNGIDAAAVHRLVWTVINQRVDETLDNGGHHIEIALQDTHVISIRDDGDGIPIELDPHTGRSRLDYILTGLPGRKAEMPYPAYRISMFDVGLASVNAVCAAFSVQINGHGFLWQQQYKEGKPQAELERVRPLLSSELSGTTITFSPDFSIFDQCEFDYQLLAHRCRELAYLVSGLTIELTDKRSSYEYRTNLFSSSDGLKAYVSCLNRGYRVLHDPIVFRETVELQRDYQPLGYAADIAIALQYAQVHQPVLLGFVNAFEVEQGGTHIRGLLEALTRAISDYAESIGVGGYYTFIEDDILYGLAAVLNIWHPAPVFAGAARYELMNPELEHAVYRVVLQALEAFSTKHPDQMQRIIEKCLKNKTRRFHRRYRT